MYTLYRDDDISVTSDINLLLKVHDLFIKYNKIHTVAVLMQNIWENKEVWYWLMTAPNLRIGLHGWRHWDYSDMREPEIAADFDASINYWRKNVVRGKYPMREIKVFFPPWNRFSPALAEVCRLYDFDLDARVGPPVYNFHYWACQDGQHMLELEEALKT